MFNRLLAPFQKQEKQINDHYFIHQPTTRRQIADQIRSFADCAALDRQKVVILCIGTDRSTGDSLGPITGTKLRFLLPNLPIFGTLDEPVHATNLVDKLSTIHREFPHRFTIAIDACLGKSDHVGSVSLGLGTLKPGTAVQKELPPVGDAYITGIVNVGGFMEHMVLQSTRLSLVVKMANTIAYGIAYGLREH